MRDLIRQLSNELENSLQTSTRNEELSYQLQELQYQIQKYNEKIPDYTQLLNQLDNVLNSDEFNDDNFNNYDLKDDKIKQNSTFSNEKEQLLDGLNLISLDNNIRFKDFLKAVAVFLLIVCFISVFVSLRERIYKSSRTYAELINKKEVLLEEQKELKRKIESLQFQNNIMNYFD